MQNRKSEPAKVVPATQQTTNAWTKPFVSSMKKFPVAMSATKRSFSGQSNNQYQTSSKSPIQQNKAEQMDDVLETINIALTGTTSLLSKISAGNTHLVHALKNIMEATMDAIKAHSPYI